jgi:hypothetical protein
LLARPQHRLLNKLPFKPLSQRSKLKTSLTFKPRMTLPLPLQQGKPLKPLPLKLPPMLLPKPLPMLPHANP